MLLRHLAAYALLIASLLAAGLWHGREPSRIAPLPCAHPYLLDDGPRAAMRLCSPSPTLGASTLLALSGHRCHGQGRGDTITVRAGETLQVDANCDVEVRATRGALRLVLGLSIDLNRATADELRALPRIGPALAKRIIDDRKRRGPFASVADLQRVHGIGERTVTRLRPLVTVSSPVERQPAPR